MASQVGIPQQKLSFLIIQQSKDEVKCILVARVSGDLLSVFAGISVS